MQTPKQLCGKIETSRQITTEDNKTVRALKFEEKFAKPVFRRPFTTRYMLQGARSITYTTRRFWLAHLEENQRFPTTMFTGNHGERLKIKYLN